MDARTRYLDDAQYGKSLFHQNLMNLELIAQHSIACYLAAALRAAVPRESSSLFLKLFPRVIKRELLAFEIGLEKEHPIPMADSLSLSQPRSFTAKFALKEALGRGSGYREKKTFFRRPFPPPAARKAGREIEALFNT